MVAAKNIDAITSKLIEIQKKIEETSLKANDLSSKKNKLLAELKKLDVQYGKSSFQLKRLENDVKRLNKKLKKDQQLIRIKQKEIASQKNALASQVKVAFGMGKNEKLKLILNQKDPSVSDRMLVYYDYLNKARQQRIIKIDQGLQSLRALETKKLKETEELKIRVDQVGKQKSALLETKNERKALLTKINKKVSLKKKQLSRFKVSEKKLKGLILSLQQTIDDFSYEKEGSDDFGLLKGKLPWPVRGKVIKKFGAQRSDSRWDGVLIDVKEGADIRAIAAGRIVYADWLRGYGLLTIIDHGKGYMTLYAFNQGLYKKVGEWVSSGAVIAAVGQSGGQSKSGLYFGIRKKGKPVNPVKWCRKK